jgi:hypothetical protein
MPPAFNKPQALIAARRAAGLLHEATAATDELLNSLSMDVKHPIETDLKAAHRRAHRVGVPSKLATDPEVRAFVESRYDTHTFDDITKAVAETFPPERRVSRSSIHRWWQKMARG